jgi:hypothetical protein
MFTKVESVTLLIALAGCTPSPYQNSLPDSRTEKPLSQPTHETIQAELERKFIGKPAGQAIDHFNVPFDAIETEVQWAWVLAAISFEATISDHLYRVFIWVDAPQTPSQQFAHAENIRKSKVTKIRLYAIDDEKNFLEKPASVVMDHYKIQSKDLSHLLGDVGYLNSVYFKVNKGDYNVNIYLKLSGKNLLLPRSVRLNYEAIRKAKVTAITTKLAFE